MEVREDGRELMELFLSNRISVEQHARLVTLMREPGSEAVLELILKESFYGPGPVDHAEDSMEEALQYLEGLKVRMNADPAPTRSFDPAPAPALANPIPDLAPDAVNPTPARMIPLRKWAGWAAAAVLLFTAGSAWLLFRGRDKKIPAQAVRFRNDVAPGGDKAVLILADGSRITLDSARNGKLAVQGDALVYKKDGAVSYQATEKAKTLYNTVSTPAKGQYRLTLADGTGVWLDALSTIRFPTAFSGNAREVEVTGQVYFELKADPEHPFRVRVNNLTVEALGTHFNINAYKDEPVIRTTLAAGLVRVFRDSDSNGDTDSKSNGSSNSANNSVTLHPGKQAAAEPGGTLNVVDNPNMEEILAWKDGLFHFNGTNIETIMRQVARWYGVKVVYKDKVGKQFVGEIPRDVPLARLLSLLELTHLVHFTIEGQTITVMK